MSAPQEHYDETTISFLSDIWGDGFMSPGGVEEASLVLEGLDLTGATVLDIGSGSGAISVLLVEKFAADKVIGIDVEEPVCKVASKRIEKMQLEKKIEIRLVTPGKLDFEDSKFDYVYSKDSIVHIPDKYNLCSEVFRVLKPGGWFAASDWLISHDGEPSTEMKAYLKAEDLDFALASPSQYKEALEMASFTNIQFINRQLWHSEQVNKELLFLTGKENGRLKEQHGDHFINEQVDIWKKMKIVASKGELCPHIFRAQKPFKVQSR